MLSIQNSIPQFSEIETHMLSLKEIDEDEIKSSVRTMHFIAGGVTMLGFLLTSSNPDVGPAIFWIGLLIYGYFIWKPNGKAGELKQSVNEFVESIKSFKVTSDRIIIENMIPQDKSLN